MKQKNNIGCFTTIIGTIIVIVATLIYSVLSALFYRFFIQQSFGEQSSCALLSFAMPSCVIAFVIFELIFIAWELKTNGNSETKSKMQKLFKFVLCGGICLSFLLMIFSANTYIRLNDTSIQKVCFAETNKYTWIEKCNVQKYTFHCDEQGILTYTIQMKDGEKISLFDSVNSCTDSFIDKYGNLYGYAAHLTNEFKNSDFIIEGAIIGREHMENHYKNNPDVWCYIEQIIKE